MDSTEILCLRCGTEMDYLKREKIQLGQQGVFMGEMSHIAAGALDVHMFCCPNCGKMEFFNVKVIGGMSEYDDDAPYNADEQIDKKQCPQCGQMHDMDYPKCPYCKYEYDEEVGDIADFL